MNTLGSLAPIGAALESETIGSIVISLIPYRRHWTVQTSNLETGDCDVLSFADPVDAQMEYEWRCWEALS